MSVTQAFELRLDFQNYWHTGSGKSSGHHLDALCQKDADGLPYVSGRQLKGLLRHAVRRAEAWGWYEQAKQALQLTDANAVETVLFGSASQEDSRFDSEPGMVFVGNAELAEDERTWLAQPEQTRLRSQLYVDMYNTAIDADSGTVVKHFFAWHGIGHPCELVCLLEFQTHCLRSGCVCPTATTAESKHLPSTD